MGLDGSSGNLPGASYRVLVPRGATPLPGSREYGGVEAHTSNVSADGEIAPERMPEVSKETLPSRTLEQVGGWLSGLRLIPTRRRQWCRKTNTEVAAGSNPAPPTSL
jgi:hypothetical protein